MKRITNIFFVFTMCAALAACSSNAANPGEVDASNVQPEAKAVEETIEKVTIPSGARIRVALIDAVSTDKSSPGDEFMASLAEPVVVDGKTIVEKGSRVQGRVVDVNESGRVKGRASINLILTSMTVNGETVNLQTKPFVAVAEATKARDAKIIGGAAGVGAVIGAIAGGGDGAAKGALIGGGAGTGTVLATKGQDLRYPPETRLNFTLSAPVTVEL